jgi:hypothetical protein
MKKPKVVILDDNPLSITLYIEEHPELFRPKEHCRCILIKPSRKEAEE